jgi:hypothetical protein
MSIWGKLSLASAMLVASVGPSFAFWRCTAPEIDGPAGVSALALLVTAGMVAYNRAKG